MTFERVPTLRRPRSRGTLAQFVVPNRFVLALALALATGIASCGGETEPRADAPTVSGTWLGSVGGATLMLNLSERNGVVTGDASSYAGTFWVPLTVTGTYSAPSLALTLATRAETASVHATFADAHITGTADGAGANGSAVALQSSAAPGVGVPISVTIVPRHTTIEPNVPDSVWAVAKDKFGNRLRGVQVTWASGSASVATIAPSAADNVKGAVVTQVGPGPVTITATATNGGASATGTVDLTSTNSPWIGHWTLTTVGELSVPTGTLIGSGFPTRYVSRVMDIRGDGTGSWADSTLSGAQCTPKSGVMMCDASGRGDFTWAASGNTLSFTSAVKAVGVFPLRVFTKAGNGSLLNTSEGYQTAFFRP